MRIKSRMEIGVRSAHFHKNIAGFISLMKFFDVQLSQNLADCKKKKKKAQAFQHSRPTTQTLEELLSNKFVR